MPAHLLHRGQLTGPLAIGVCTSEIAERVRYVAFRGTSPFQMAAALGLPSPAASTFSIIRILYMVRADPSGFRVRVTRNVISCTTCDITVDTFKLAYTSGERLWHTSWGPQLTSPVSHLFTTTHFTGGSTVQTLVSTPFGSTFWGNPLLTHFKAPKIS